MKKQPHIIILLGLTLITFFSIALFAQQEEPATQDFKLRRIWDFQCEEGVWDWVITGKKSSFLWSYNGDNYPLPLFYYKLSERGMASSRFNFLYDFSGLWISDIDGLWLTDKTIQAPPKKINHGLMFVASLNLKSVIFEAFKFDAEGHRPSWDQKGYSESLYETSRGTYYPIGYIMVGGGPKTIGVIISAHFDASGSEIYESKAFFMETDFDGHRVGDVAEIRLPKKGNYCKFFPLQPIHNGKMWLVPGVNVSLKRTSDEYGRPTSKPRANQLFVFSIKGSASSGRKISRLKVAKDNQAVEHTFRAHFIPQDVNSVPTSPAGKAEKQYLFIGHVNIIPEDQRELDDRVCDYSIQEFSKGGKKVGAAIKIEIPKWEHSMSYDPNKLTYLHREYISNLIRTKTGKAVFAMARSLLRRWPQASPTGLYEYDYEHELNLYEVDPVNGMATLLARGTPTAVGYFKHPLVRWFDGQIAVINERYAGYDEEGGPELATYYTKF